MHFFPFEISVIESSGRGEAKRDFSLDSDSLRRFAGALVTLFSVAVSDSRFIETHFSQLQNSGNPRQDRLEVDLLSDFLSSTRSSREGETT